MRGLSVNQLRAALAATLLAVASTAQAAVITLDFEGLQDLEAVEEFYNGGAGSSGSTGSNLGASFSSNALAIIDSDAGGTGSIGGEPSPDTILFFLSGGAATLNLAAGFDTGFSFFYSAINSPGSINVYDGLNATGAILATLVLPTTASDGGDPTGLFSPFVATGVSFLGIAKSIDFGGTANQIAFDNITFGSSTPTDPSGPSTVPVPAALPLLAGALGALSFLARRRAKA